MFNLIVKTQQWGRAASQVLAGRIFEYTNADIEAQFTRDGRPDIAALSRLPTVLMVETGYGDDIARIVNISRATVARDGSISLEYQDDPVSPTVLNSQLRDGGGELGIEDFEFARTHWAVKDADLFRFLLRTAQPRRPRPAVFHLPEYERIEPTLVSAMMPFDLAFNPVNVALREAAEDAGRRYRRADDIWENPHVMQDVVGLIDRSRVVIADCTGRNPNVFYEVGIAHTLGREVLLITQADSDIPFDLRHLRYVRYLNNGEGLAELKRRIRAKLEDIG